MNENGHSQAAYIQHPCSLPFKARNEFIRRINGRIRWDEWLYAIKQLFMEGLLEDSQIEYILRAHILSKVLCLSNKDLPEAIFDSLALREFMGFRDPNQASLDMDLLTSFRERIQAIGLDERIEYEISFLMCSSDSGHSEEQAVNMSNTDQAESTFLLEDPGTIIDPNHGLPAFWDMTGLRAQYQDIPLILPSYYPPVWADDWKRAKSESKTSADPPAGNENGWNTADLPQLQPASILSGRTAHARKNYRQRRNLLPAALLMTSFLVGTYVFGAELYQRARAKTAGEISAFSSSCPDGISTANVNRDE